MIHFRLRRSLRLAAVHLSSHLAGSSVNYRFLHLPLRGTPVSRAPIFRHPVLSSFALPRMPHFVSEQFRCFRHRAHPPTRRYLASNALLLALSLEVCGCNPVADSSLSLNSPVISGTYETPRFETAISFYDPPDASASIGGNSSPLLMLSNLSVDPHPLETRLRDDRALDKDTVDSRSLDSRLGPIENSPLIWSIPESVYLVYRGRHSGEALEEYRPHQAPIATAFVLSIPNLAHTGYTRFLVTARHVVDPQWANCSEPNPTSIDLRLNRRTGGFGYETIQLQSGARRNFYTSPNSDVDLAVIPLDKRLIPRLEEYKFIDIPFRLLPTESELHLLRTDQQIMTARPSGEPGNYPVFGSGVLSSMPVAPIGVLCGAEHPPQPPVRPVNVWFIDAGVAQGVSGAPVYTSIARGPGIIRNPILLGIQSFAWPDQGVAGITPAPALESLIQSALRRDSLNLDLYRGPNP